MKVNQTSCLNRASIWPVSIITNSCSHSTIFINNTRFPLQLSYAATILTIWTSSIEPYVYFSYNQMLTPEDGSLCVLKHVGVNFTWTFNVFLINIVLWVRKLVIIENGHIDAWFKHVVLQWVSTYVNELLRAKLYIVCRQQKLKDNNLNYLVFIICCFSRWCSNSLAVALLCFWISCIRFTSSWCSSAYCCHCLCL